MKTLQSQLTKAKEELAIVNVERDHLNSRLMNSLQCGGSALGDGAGDRKEADVLLKKVISSCQCLLT